MAAVGKAHRQNGIARLQKRHVEGRGRLRNAAAGDHRAAPVGGLAKTLPLVAGADGLVEGEIFAGVDDGTVNGLRGQLQAGQLVVVGARKRRVGAVGLRGQRRGHG